MSLWLPQRDDDWSKYLWFIVFFGLPLAARALKALLTAAGVLKPEEQTPREDPRETLRRRREERRQAEQEGEDLWRRLARGEVVEPPPQPVAPAPTAMMEPPVAKRAPLSRSLEIPAPEMSLETQSEAAPLAVMGEVHEPGAAPEVSLEAAVEPTPLAALTASAVVESVSARPSFRLAPGELRRAMILTEILGPPLAERPLRA